MNPKLANAVVKSMAIAGIAAIAGTGNLKDAYRATRSATSGGLDPKDVPTVVFAVHEPTYKEWMEGYNKRKTRRQLLFWSGGAIAVLSFTAMCASGIALAPDIAILITLCTLLVGVGLLVSGALYSFAAVQPLLHSAEVSENRVSVLGASDEFLRHLPDLKNFDRAAQEKFFASSPSQHGDSRLAADANEATEKPVRSHRPRATRTCTFCGTKLLPKETTCPKCKRPQAVVAEVEQATLGRCLACRGPLDVGAVICVSCGLDLRTGQTLASSGTKAAGPTPPLVRAWGNAIMLLAGLLIAANWIGAIVILFVHRLSQADAIGMIVLVLFQIAVHWVLLRLGEGLRNGERSAVRGLIVILGLCVVIAGPVLYFGFTGRGTADGAHVAAIVVAGFLLFIATVVCAPPIMVAFNNWSSFR